MANADNALYPAGADGVHIGETRTCLSPPLFKTIYNLWFKIETAPQPPTHETVPGRAFHHFVANSPYEPLRIISKKIGGDNRIDTLEPQDEPPRNIAYSQ